MHFSAQAKRCLGEPTVAVVRPIQNSERDRERMVAVAEIRRFRDYLGIPGATGLFYFSE